MKLLCAMIVGAGVMLSGCSSDNGSRGAGTTTEGTALTSAQQAKVDRAAAVAGEIRANPDNADAVLQGHGMTEQQFEDLMYEIAADPAMSRAYDARTGK